MYRLLFLGTSEFAIPSFKALASDPRFSIIGVVTQPDRPVGRHAVLTPPPIKTVAQELGLPIFQPETIKELETNSDFQSLIANRPDVFVVVSYGKILPQRFLDLPTQGCVNVHGSLLPRWRGAAPIQAAIASGDKKSGVTVMQLDADLDHGAILGAAEEPITKDDTGATLHDRLAELGGEILPDILAGYLNSSITPVEQDHSQATFCKTMSRDDGKIDWNKSAEEIERMVRGYTPWPGTWTEFEGKRLKIHSVRIGPATTEPAGTFFDANNNKCVASGNGTSIILERVQREGGKPTVGSTLLR
ncbi:MAG: methionyl-tRNA formyltransferase [Patescibacteria group bacterium]